MTLRAALHTYVLESRELLEEMERALLSSGGAGAVHAVFRAVHTIKGSAGLFGLDHVVDFAHVVESVLDEVRGAALALDAELVALLLSCRDHLAALVDGAIDGLRGGAGGADASLAARGGPLLARLRVHLGRPGAEDAAPAGHAAPPGPAAPPAAEAAVRRWHISLRFGVDALRNGMDPLAFIRYLGRLGTVTGVATLDDAMPEPAAMDPESCYLGFEIAFQGGADRAAIEGVFDFVREDCAIRILGPDCGPDDYAALLDGPPEEAARLREALARCGGLAAAELAESAGVARPERGGRAPRPAPAPSAPDGSWTALAVPEPEQAAAPRESRSIRVDADKLDHLINLIGELVIAGASASVAAGRARDAELRERNATLAALVEQVRDSALQLRMVKIGATFSRFQRVVHDVSRETGKDIGLVVQGGDTELDKTVVERIGDPLTHLVRNAIDHGIEGAELRAARGKPARGTVRLNAYHESGSIVIEVGDDGGGLDRDRILAKAVERGLVEPERRLSDGEIHALVFEPGFSTAAAVTNLSGRGVGMDVVKRGIAELRGEVAIASEEGVGTTVTVRLPLTLAIIDGFLVAAGGSMFVIPLDTIEECLAFNDAEAGRDYTDLRGQVLPFARLRALFALDGEPSRRESLVVVRHEGRRVGLVVDTLLGEFQTVIKPLGKLFGQVRCVSGATVLGSGEVALILDMPALLATLARPGQPVPAIEEPQCQHH
ncbi:chemotaxis protein CheA [Pseudoduganella namucuonensis]|uniref:Chemotaxis protein CheA n=1 Tax=Pseudoduganella namucuonensis TaxID=1035707 RepID=A0A1I7H7M3_9BURK|nr:chemotaxis protein CheA [Pseudoduganella namucuonensis]SFU56486.1 two-component system, chemotaxis family, sensor kinase CheA [Pseudoduganella namucuonensis]